MEKKKLDTTFPHRDLYSDNITKSERRLLRHLSHRNMNFIKANSKGIKKVGKYSNLWVVTLNDGTTQRGTLTQCFTHIYNFVNET